MPTLEHDGVKQFYRDEGKGQPVLLLHGFPLSSESFWPQLDVLPRRHRLIVPDHRGFGRSSLDDGPTEMRRMAEDALAILDALKVSSAVVGGLSMGGYVAMAMAKLEPDRVKALVLIDTQAGSDSEADRQKREELARAVEAKGLEVLVDSMMPRLISHDTAPAVRARVQALIRANTSKGAAAALRGMALRPDSKEVLSRFAGPALVVVGEKDVITPVEKAQEMAGVIPKSKLVQLPAVGHLSNVEAPEAFNRHLEEFLTTTR
jgi:pimeloyl-ACP methyl ester carboxylesterase